MAAASQVVQLQLVCVVQVGMPVDTWYASSALKRLNAVRMFPVHLSQRTTDMARLDGKKALVIGAASGIGAAVMERFAREGAHVWGTGRRGPEIETAAARAGAHAITADPGSEADLDQLASRLRDEAGQLDILVVNAGMSEPAMLEEVTADHFDRHFDLNVRALLFATQALLPLMRAGSAVVLVGSIAGSKGVPARGVYSATKAAVRALARSWTAELAPRGIRVNLVSPGPTDTAMMAWTTPQEREALVSMIPLGRMGRVEEVAAAALFLVSDESSYVAGVELFVDGGMAQV